MREVCSLTVMDTSDPDIKFDENGVSNHALHARKRLQSEVFPGAAGEALLKGIVERIKQEGAGKPYDCVAGISGGVDSSYVLVLARELGLRPLAIHVDNGWNTELAVANIEKLLRKLDIDLITYVIDWEEVKDLQRSQFLASVANVESITDHSIGAVLHKKAAEMGVRFILQGSNVATESIMPDSWGYDARDSRSIRSIHRKFGRLKTLKSYPFLEPLEFLKYVFVDRIRYIPILNYSDYRKSEVIERLKTEFGWTPYPRKHGESRFTRFFQEYYLPEKFGFDKRKAHFSSMIVAGQMTRDAAFAELNKPLLRPEERDIEIAYVTKKLGFSVEEWEQIMRTPLHQAQEFPNNAWMFDHSSPIIQFVRRVAKGEKWFSKARPAAAR